MVACVEIGVCYSLRCAKNPMITFFKTKLLPHPVTQLLIKTVTKWQKDKCLEMGAALAYYALFSLFPILLVITSVVGFLLGPDTDVFKNILDVASNSLPAEAAGIVEQTLLQMNQGSVRAGIIGFALSLFAASSVFGALDRSVDRIWKAEEDEESSSGVLSTATSFLMKKLLAFGLVMTTAALLLLSLVSNIAIRVILQVIAKMDRNITAVKLDTFLIARGLQIGSSFLLVALAVLLLLRFLPSTATPWKDVWPGAILTTALLLGLQQLISRNIIQIGAQYQSYGVIGGVMILMMWLFFTCQIFFFGCAFSYVYAHMFGSRRRLDLEL